MMDTGNFYFAFAVTLAVIGLAVAVYLVKSKRLRYQEMKDIVTMLVCQAEQQIPKETGPQKLQWVLDRCAELGITKVIPETALRAIIEFTVFWINQNKAPKLPATGGQGQPPGDGPGRPSDQPPATDGTAQAASPATIDAVDALLFAGLVGQPAKRARRRQALATDSPSGSGEASAEN